MLNTKKIEQIMSELGKTKADICRITGMGRPTFDAILKGSDARISTIESIAKALKVHIGFLFDEEVDVDIRAAGRDYVEKGKIEHKGTEYTGSSETDLRDQIAQLKSQLADKERIIKLLEREQPH